MTFHVHWALKVRPLRRQDLSDACSSPDRDLLCARHQRRFQNICGIPDLRILPDRWISFEGPDALVRRSPGMVVVAHGYGTDNGPLGPWASSKDLRW
jgi:hypothetical protein